MVSSSYCVYKESLYASRDRKRIFTFVPTNPEQTVLEKGQPLNQLIYPIFSCNADAHTSLEVHSTQPFSDTPKLTTPFLFWTQLLGLGNCRLQFVYLNLLIAFRNLWDERSH